MDNGHTQVLEINYSPTRTSHDSNIAFINSGVTIGGDNASITVNVEGPVLPTDVHAPIIQCTNSTIVQFRLKEIHSDSKVDSSIT